MNKNNIRSAYVKNLLAEKSSLDKRLEEATRESMREILAERVDAGLRQLLSEAEDENAYDEEEVDATMTTDEIVPNQDDAAQSAETEVDVDAEVADAEDATDVDVETTEVEDVESTEDDADGEKEVDADWSEFEQYKDEDGEYDLTGMDMENALRVLRVVDPNKDGIRVVKNNDGSITLSDENTEAEYIIDIDSDVETEDATNESLGYTDNYQKKTAMTTPDNHEPANSKTTYSMDAGVPTGTEKPWAGKGDKAPYTEEVSEECEYEVEMEEDAVEESMTTQENGAYNRGTGMIHTNTNDKAAKGRNAHAGGRQIHGTADNSYSNAQLENIRRKANVIFNENKQLRQIVGKLRDKVEESIVVNSSMGKIVKLVMENATSQDEKVSIVKRFNNVKTVAEAQSLYETIDRELKSTNKNINENIQSAVNGQVIAESAKTNIVETSLYQSEDLAQTVGLMERLEKIK